MAHGGFLREHSGDPELASHTMHDYTQAKLDPQTRAMLDFAAKLTRTPAAMAQADVQRLRNHGLNDEQILSTVLITCTFNFMTRPAGRQPRRGASGWPSGVPLTVDERSHQEPGLADDSSNLSGRSRWASRRAALYQSNAALWRPVEMTAVCSTSPL